MLVFLGCHIDDLQLIFAEATTLSQALHRGYTNKTNKNKDNMGNFISLFFSRRDYRLVVLGLDGAGKTTALYRLQLGETMTTCPTIGFNVETIEYRNVKMTMWDVGGQDKIRALWSHYFHGVHGVIYVVDSADPSRMDEAKEELDKVLSHQQMDNVPLLVLANKMDQYRSLPVDEVVARMGLDQHRSRRQWNALGTIATQGKGVYEGLDWLVEVMRKT
ncbi:putative ADP-ribosylation factor [Planoprotostelium fungivorum]|uniref:Putative ADP-ribosylation factor n=1 Tax=Planoprotostelium fungivorum TaxID=1890364 RepID=A0A2P6MUN7_9EUKA|nr:putative ADP-ribosylation factor [Planoprotostelium fungivorum]